MRDAVLTLLLCAMASVASAQRDATQRTVSVGTAALSGQIVTTDEPARPMRRVLVTLSGAELRGDRQVVSDDQGRFVFDRLVAGRYTLTAEKPAYVTIHYGSPRPGFGPGTPVSVADGQTEQVLLRMPRGAVIAGVIRAANGQPIAAAQAQLSRPQMVAGQLRAAAVPGVRSTTTTDDKGRFRFYGLPPGEYVVRGGGNSAMVGEVRMTTEAELDAAARMLAQVSRSGPTPFATPAPAPPVPRVVSAITYAPDSADLEGAQRFRVAAGQEILDVDITVKLARTGAIAGTSIGPGGEPLSNVMVSLVNTRARSLWASPGLIRPDVNGAFRLPGLAEGEYALIGRAADPSAAQGPMQLYAETPFTMNGDDLSGLVLSFDRGSTVSGRVEVMAGVVPTGLRVGLTPVGIVAGAAAAPAAEPVLPDGTFAITGVPPGRYRITTSGTTALTLRSAMLADVDTLDGTFDVNPREDVTGMRVAMTSKPTQLTGTLLDGLGRPAPEFSVVVFSTDRAHWASAPRRLTGLVKLDSKGSYRITGLPPGSYYLAAVTDAEPSELSDPAFLEQLATAALTITLAEGQARVQDIRMRQ